MSNFDNDCYATLVIVRLTMMRLIKYLIDSTLKQLQWAYTKAANLDKKKKTIISCSSGDLLSDFCML